VSFWRFGQRRYAGGYNITRSYVWGPDFSDAQGSAGGAGSLLAIYNPGYTLTYAMPDALGNIVGHIDASGALVAAVEYTPYGRAINSFGTLADYPIGFSGQYTDWETGLVYYGLRYYMPKHGRFINRDPIEEAGGTNLYGFCGNGPVDGFDMLGMFETATVYLTQTGFDYSGNSTVKVLGTASATLNDRANGAPGQLLTNFNTATYYTSGITIGIKQDSYGDVVFWVSSGLSGVQPLSMLEPFDSNNNSPGWEYHKIPPGDDPSRWSNPRGGGGSGTGGGYTPPPVPPNPPPFALAPNSGALIGGAITTQTLTSSGAGNVTLSEALANAGISTGGSTVLQATGVGMLAAFAATASGDSYQDPTLISGVIYMKPSLAQQGVYYVGRTIGEGTPLQVLAGRDLYHERNLQGYGPAIIHSWATGTATQFGIMYDAVRGREQQVIDAMGGVGSPRVGNTIRGVSMRNPFGFDYWNASNGLWGPLAPFTGYMRWRITTPLPTQLSPLLRGVGPGALIVPGGGGF